MERILITGGSGFIGRHLHAALPPEAIVNLDLRAPQFAHGATYVPGDVRELASLERALAEHPCTTILSLAAEHKDFGVAEEHYFRTNEHGTRMVCEAARRQGVRRIVFLSSVAIYGEASVPTTEATAARPINPYGASKWAAEQVLREWAAEDAGREVLILRPTVVYGPGNLANMYRLIRQIDRGLYVTLGRGDTVKSVAYVGNLVNATLFLMARMRPGVEVFNFADEPQLTTRAIADTIAENLGRRAPASLPYALVRLLALPFDAAIRLTGRDLPISGARVAKLHSPTIHSSRKLIEAGYQPRFTTPEGLKLMVSWYLEHKRDPASHAEALRT